MKYRSTLCAQYRDVCSQSDKENRSGKTLLTPSQFPFLPAHLFPRTKMSTKITFIPVLIFLLWASIPCHAQGPYLYFQNPSLEGPRRADFAPPGWIQFSTPNTQPGFWGITMAPSHGGSFVSMVARNDGSYETIQQILPYPTLPDTYWYYLTLDLAWEPTPDQPYPIRLEVEFASTVNGTRSYDRWHTIVEEMAKTPIIDHTYWKQYVIEMRCWGNDIQPYDAIIFRSRRSDSLEKIIPSYHYTGTLCMDNISPLYLGKPEYFSVDLGKDTIICKGRDSLLLDAGISGDAEYKWSNGATSSTVWITDPGTYWVSVTRKSITRKDTIVIGAIEPPPVNLGQDTLLCMGERIVLSREGSGDFLWSNGQTTSSIVVEQAGVYALAYAEDGCTSRDTIRVEFMDCEQFLTMPNVFSPNGDGNNDLLLPLASKNVITAEIQVFDRWGREVASTSLLEGWDGLSGGRPCPEGVYFYTLVYSDLFAVRHTQQGSFTLFR